MIKSYRTFSLGLFCAHVKDVYNPESEYAMSSTVTPTQTTLPSIYLDVVRLNDGRYRIKFIKNQLPPRTSYVWQASFVVQQAKRAGNIAIRTSDSTVQEHCNEQNISLIISDNDS